MRDLAKYILTGVLALGGCVPFGQDTESGNISLEGRAVLISGSYTRTCEDITLARATDDTSKKISALSQAPDGFVSALNFRAVEVDNDFARVSRTAECDSDGHFQFSNLPAGHYFLVARITGLLGHAHRGGFLIRRIDIAGAVQGIDIIARDRNSPGRWVMTAFGAKQTLG
jgi:hypothetical protein